MQKKTIIKKIRAIIKEFGLFTTGDVFADTSPCIASIGNNTVQLVEKFLYNNVEAVLYVHDREEDTDMIAYEDLSKDVLEEILYLAEQWEADQIQTEKRISN